MPSGKHKQTEGGGLQAVLVQATERRPARIGAFGTVVNICSAKLPGNAARQTPAGAWGTPACVTAVP